MLARIHTKLGGESNTSLHKVQTPFHMKQTLKISSILASIWTMCLCFNDIRFEFVNNLMLMFPIPPFSQNSRSICLILFKKYIENLHNSGLVNLEPRNQQNWATSRQIVWHPVKWTSQHETTTSLCVFIDIHL